MISRRTFVAAGVAGAAALAAAWWLRGRHAVDMTTVSTDQSPMVMDADASAIIAAIVPVMLAGALPVETKSRAEAIRETVAGVDRTVIGLPPAAQKELAQLFALLAFTPGRLALARISAPWDQASPDEVADFLERWRNSGFTLLRSAYDALHQLIFAAWYGNPVSWAAIGYGGPPSLS
jgi:hypothetical protein